jgi:hypothetical protein
MKNSYEKYIKEVGDIKEAVYNDFLRSGFKSYMDFLKSEAKKLNIGSKDIQSKGMEK